MEKVGMAKYSRTVYEMVEEVITELEEPFAPKDIIDVIQRKFPEDQVKENTIRCHVIASAVNHPSRHHYIKPKYQHNHQSLFYLGRGSYRIYRPEKDGKWIVDDQGPRKIREEIEKGENIVYHEISSNNQVVIPTIIRKKLVIKPGDYLAFVIRDDGEIIIKKARMKIEIVE